MCKLLSFTLHDSTHYYFIYCTRIIMYMGTWTIDNLMQYLPCEEHFSTYWMCVLLLCIMYTSYMKFTQPHWNLRNFPNSDLYVHMYSPLIWIRTVSHDYSKLWNCTHNRYNTHHYTRCKYCCRNSCFGDRTYLHTILFYSLVS